MSPGPRTVLGGLSKRLTCLSSHVLDINSRLDRLPESPNPFLMCSLAAQSTVHPERELVACTLVHE